MKQYIYKDGQCLEIVSKFIEAKSQSKDSQSSTNYYLSIDEFKHKDFEILSEEEAKSKYPECFL